MPGLARCWSPGLPPWKKEASRARTLWPFSVQSTVATCDPLMGWPVRSSAVLRINLLCLRCASAGTTAQHDEPVAEAENAEQKDAGQQRAVAHPANLLLHL